MKTSRAPQAKIVNHDSGMGAPDNGTVRRRATELALIDGRSAFNEEDWRQAKRELHGGHPQDEEEGVDSHFESVSERDMISTNAGHQVENVPLDDAVTWQGTWQATYKEYERMVLAKRDLSPEGRARIKANAMQAIREYQRKKRGDHTT